MDDITQRRAAGTALIASGSIFFATEFITAAAWTDPPYSYTHHLISHLGVHGPATVFGQFIRSPLASVMNTGFVLFGIAALVGVGLLSGLPASRRWAITASATLLAIGGVLVGMFPGPEDSGTTDFHGMGANAALLSGNVLSILIGRAHRYLGLSRRLGRALVLSGILGLGSVVAFRAALGSDAGVLIGLAERCIVYPFLIGLIIAGTALWKRRAQNSTGRASIRSRTRA